MGWNDSLPSLAQAPKPTGVGFSTLPTGFTPLRAAPLSFTGTSSNWLSSFSAATQGWTGATAQPKTGYTPPAFPESINITLPWSSASTKPPPPARDTTGDFIASLGASFDNSLWQGGYLNVANAIPWAMERNFVVAKTMADQVEGGGGSLIGDIINNAAGLFKAAAEPVAAAFDLLPNMVRDSQLNSRADIYRAFVQGRRVDPIQTFFAQPADLYRINAVNRVVDLLSGGGSPDELATARSLVAQVIDLPESVKRAIEKDPDGNFAKYLDAAPEGRMFSYAPGLGGFAANLGSMGVLYALEIMATGGVGAVARGAAAATKIPYAASLFGAAATGASVMAKAQKLLLASGINYFAASTIVDATLRTMGNKAGVAYLDRINRTTLVSDSPAVQLVSSFTVNPIGAAKAALKGELKFLGSPLIVVDKITGGRFRALYNHETVVLDRLAAMYGISRASAAELIGPGRVYETKADAFDQVVSLAADSFVKKLPEEARAVINALPIHQRVNALISQYGRQIMDEVASPVGLIASFRNDWSHHDFYGKFDPEIAKLVTRDFREAQLKTVAAREATDTVVGYVDLLNPEGQSIVADTIEGLFAEGRGGTLRDLNALSAKHPSLNGLVKDLVAKGENGRPFSKPTDAVPRGVFDEALSRAKAEYEAIRAKNPVRVATGTDPILRPNVHPSEWAAALDTTQETIAALTASTRKPAQDGLIADFLRQKGLATDAEIAASSADDLYAKAYNYFDETTAPWVKRGEQVAVVETQIGAARERLAELARRKASGEGVMYGEVAAAEAEIAKLQVLLGDVRDPIAPFASGVKAATRAETEVMARARRKVEAIERVEAIQSVTDAVAPAQVHAVNDLLHSVEMTGGAWSWVADARITSGLLFDAAVSRFKAWKWLGKPNTRTAEGLFDNQPAAYQAAAMADSPGFVRYLRQSPETVALGHEATHGEIANMIEAGKRGRPVETQITPGMMDALGVTTREDFIAKLGSLRAAYDAALDGTTPYALGRTAGITVPEWAVERARAGEIATLFRDPVAESNYANALNSLRDALDGQGTFPAVRAVVEGNPLLRAQAREAAMREGQTVGDFLANPRNAEAIRSLVPDTLPDRYVPGVPKAMTALDEAILAGDAVALDELKIDLEGIRGTLAPPLRKVPVEAVDALAAAPRISTSLANDLNAAGIGWQTVIPEELLSKSDAGAKALSAILNGTFTQPPKTIMGLLATLREIENGNAANMGVGAQLAAEAQALAQAVVRDMIGDARRAGLEIGVLGMGKGLNPYTWGDDTNRMMQDLFAQNKELGGGLLIFRDEMGLQYGLKQRPKGAVSVDMSSVPGLAEELLTKRFQPWSERLGTVQLQQAFGRLFHVTNQQITFEARGRFEARMAEYGLPAKGAEAIWTAWRNFAKETRAGKWKADAQGVRHWEPASSALYATEKNIPNERLDTIAREALEGYFARSGGIPEALLRVDFAKEMRIAGSFTRRQLEKMPMGDFLQGAYGTLAHNEWATTKYFMFRFALDARFHAQNKVEASILYYGRAGLKTGEIDEGLFGMNRQAVKTVGEMDTMANTGYPFAVTRDEWIYRLLKKEQPDALRGLVEADPALFRRALREIAENDPELSRTIAAMGHTPTEYLRVMDAYYGKLMRAADPEAVIGAELARDLVKTPELAEVYGRIYERNAELLGDLRALMYGNPNRGQIERTLNSFLLYWPISYQIKAAKWLVNIMYGKIGGVQTGGLGALALDRMQADHERRMAEDPEYIQFFEENQALVFAAQMILPITPAGIGASLSPIWRDLFFPTSKAVFAVGPVYTITKFVPGLAGDLYPYLKDVPFVDEAYKAATGWKPPEEKKSTINWGTPPVP